MKRKLLIALGIFVALVLILAVALPLLVNADRYRPEVESQASAALGREVKIGKLSLSLFSGGVSASDISVADDPAFSSKPFLQAKSLDVGVELMPLIFSKALHVTSLTLQEPEIHLVRNARAKWNYSTIGTTAATRKEAKKTGSPPSSAEGLSIGKLAVKDGKMIVSRGQGRDHVYSDLNVEASNISTTSVIPFEASAKTPGDGKLKVEGKAGPLNQEDASATPVLADVKVEHLDIGATGFLDPSSGIAGVADVTSKLHSDGKKARLEGTVHADRLKLVKSGSPAKQPVSVDYAADYDVERKAGNLTKGVIQTGKSAVNLGGSFDTHGEAAVVHMKMNGNNLPINDIAGLLPALGVNLPPGASLQGGTATANLTIDGPVDRLVISGPVNISNTRIAGFDVGSKMRGLGSLAGIQSSPDTIIQTLSTNVRVAPDGIRTEALNLILPQIGSVTGAGTISPNNELNFKMLAKLNNGGGLVGGLSQLTSMGKSKGELPFFIQGTTNNPLFVPDVANAVGQTVTAPAKGIGGVFGGLFGKK
jgi:AsmA protein